MKKILLCLLLSSCVSTKPAPVINENAKVLFFCMESEDSKQSNENKTSKWVASLQRRFPDLYIIGRSFDVSSSRNFDIQLQNAVKEVKPKATLSYQYKPYSDRFKNKYIFILSDSSSNMIKDKVYHDYAWLAIQDILPDFAKELEALELKYRK
ncbi:hypothetical protein [Flectobacillus longus]|uniref:hypothetical protein n=1 Tax=Flectobacillus longus TaxID=2984207 RepID=UPI0024B6F4DE|nr:hypothetical protein [Flectobacillus longus]MDI9878903.1 hypothetical protein [Flectobacillus longus]